MLLSWNDKYFNPRSREGSDRKKMPLTSWEIDFNPRSREGSDSISNLSSSLSIYFNPRSREGSDPIPLRKELDSNISIHAPAKGATNSQKFFLPLPQFQSTLPRRERPTLHYQYFDNHMISIHAPAKGATPSWSIISYLLLFQSTLPRRERR